MMQKCFIVALIHGSFTQISMIRYEIISVLTMYMNLYRNREPVVERVRLFFVNDEQKKKLEEVKRKYHAEADILAPDDADNIIRSIKRLPLELSRNLKLCSFMGNFAYYCSDEEFSNAFQLLHEKALEWAGDPQRSNCIDNNYFEFYKGTKEREYNNKICLEYAIDFSIKILETTNIQVWVENVCELLDNADFKLISNVKRKKLIDMILQFVNDENYQQVRLLQNFIVEITLSGPDVAEYIKEIVKRQIPDYFENDYEFDLLIDKYQKNNKSNAQRMGNLVEEGDLIDRIYGHLKPYIDGVKSCNEMARTGLYGLERERIDVIKTLVCEVGVRFRRDQAKEIASLALETLENEKQIIKIKVTACEILMGLKKQELLDNCDKIYRRLLNNRKKYSNINEQGFILEKESPIELELAYELLLIIFGYTNNANLFELLFSISDNNAYMIIRSLSLISMFFDLDEERQYRAGILKPLCNYVISKSDISERDVKIQAINVLSRLTRYKETCNLALNRLLVYMGGGNADAKLAITYRLKRIIDNDPYKNIAISPAKQERKKYINNIIEQAKIDRHYLIRKKGIEADISNV